MSNHGNVRGRLAGFSLRHSATAVVMIALVLFAPVPAADAAEALALKVLGFTPDGRHFGFIQYGGVGDGGEYIAELTVIDVDRDRLVQPLPPPVASAREEKPFSDPRPYGAWLAGYAQKRFAEFLRRYEFRSAGWPIAGDEGARAAETFALSSDVRPSFGMSSVEFVDPRLGRLGLSLQTKRLPWPRSSRVENHPEATPCAEEVDWEQGAAFRLTLRRGSRSIVLHDDRTIPASRHCVLGYGISEVYSYARPDGKVSLAIVLGMAVRGFEGSDRRFLAVTAAIAP